MKPGLVFVRGRRQISLGSALITIEPRYSKRKGVTFFLFKTCFLLILVGISGISVLLPVFVEHHPLFLGFHLCQQQFLGAELCSQQQATDTDAEQRDPGRWVPEFQTFLDSSCLSCLWSPFSRVWVFLLMDLYRQHPPNSLQMLSEKDDVFIWHFGAALITNFVTCKCVNLSF